MRLFLILIFLGLVFADSGERIIGIRVAQPNGSPISRGGLVCKDCIREVKEALEPLNGVRKVSYDVRRDLFIIIVDENFDDRKIKDVIEDIGYIYRSKMQISR